MAANVGAAADLVRVAFLGHGERFAAITARAKQHFERGDWLAAQRDSARRLDLYGECVDEALVRMRAELGEHVGERDVWHAIRDAFQRSIAGRGDAELAETFFNSCVRRTLHIVGVEPALEFLGPAPSADGGPTAAVVRRFERDGSLDALCRSVLEAYAFDAPWDDLAGDARRVAAAIEAAAGDDVRALELARPAFFRGKAAYLVGRLITPGAPRPLLLALRNPAGRVLADALLLTEDEVSIVFSFARAYFLVSWPSPGELVAYLRTIMPRKPVSELYTGLGWHRHGKTELYRSLLHHLATTDDRFERAPGQRGMVMCVFTLPGFDVVFKVIRDRFDPPKTVTHAEVRQKYRLVFRHDRAGRLVDAQQFEELEFRRERFAPELLQELLDRAGETVQVRGDTVVIHHLYTERRLRPLDLYLREAAPEAARDAVQDYGQVLRDLAATNIFPGDMLLKNFGVSRHGRLIFYDYDELAPLSECRFRELPHSSDDAAQSGAEPWYYVGERDIFPEEFRTFLGLKGELLATFLAHHEELLGVAFWRRMQDVHARGEVLDIYPYRASRRLQRGTGGREGPSLTPRGANEMSVTQGEPIVHRDGRMVVPDHPVIPFIEGDGTGPDIWRAAVRVLDAAVAKAYGGKRKIGWLEVLAGQKAFDQTGNWLPDATLEAFRSYRVGIKGPLTTPVGGGIRSLNVAMRQILDLYVCLRPVRWFQGVPSPVKAPEKVDMVIFRENTEDIYAGIEFQEGTPEVQKVLAFLQQEFPSSYKKVRFPATTAIGFKPVSREGSERLIRSAIEYAIAQQRRSVTLVHKGNIMKFTEGAFRNWGYALAEKEFAAQTYTWEQWERTKAATGEAAANAEQKAALAAGRVLVKDSIADITLQQVLTRPEDFDVIATPNLNGDYLSDALAAQVGGIGIAPGGNINYVTGHAVFEATHGTAPKYANLDRVNPGSVILSGEMMLRYMGWNEAADRVLQGMDGAIAARTVTYDFARLMTGATEVKCSVFADAVIAHMK